MGRVKDLLVIGAKRIIYAEGVTHLPWNVMIPVFYIMFFNSMTITMVFAFLPKLVKSFGYTEIETGYKVGIIASCLFIARIPFSIVWGYCADRYGRKKLTMIATTLLSITTLAFGFTNNISWAIVTRLLQGTTMGIIIIVKALVIGVSDDTNSSLAMSIIIGGYSFGMIAGPVIGGFLAFPNELYPSTFSNDLIFSKFPILLPHCIVAMGLFIGIIAVAIYIPKDIERKRNISMEENAEFDYNKDNEETYLLDTQIKKDNSTTRFYQIKIVKSDSAPRRKKISKFSFKESSFGRLLLNKGCIMAVICYGLYSYIGLALAESYPLLAAAAKQYNGYGFSPSNIGTSLMATSVVVLIFQFTIMSRIIQYFGLIKCFRYCCFVIAAITPILPLCERIENKYLFWFAMMTGLASIRFFNALAFLCVNVMINNSVESDLLGFVNGFGMTISTIGRASAVGSVGSMFGWSLSNVEDVASNTDALGFPFNQYFTFFIIAVVSFGTALYSFILPKELDKQLIVNTDL